MPETTYRGRRATSIENDQLRVTVLREGGHVAEILEKGLGVNPLWTPPWPSMEPSRYDLSRHPEYGRDAEAKLLAGIMGHNLCLDLFGGPSAEEAAAGMTVHGEGATAAYETEEAGLALVQRTQMPMAQLQFERRIELRGQDVVMSEVVENLSACDRPIAWTQHVTLGPPFLERGKTQFRATATRSKVFEDEFGRGAYLKPAAEFDWPMAPLSGGGSADLQTFTAAGESSAYTTHLMDLARESAFFMAFTPALRLALGYVWKAADFPWLGIWEENHSRTGPPWNGETLTRGMEFGVSPMPESRRAMIDRGQLFGVPAYRWLPAKSRLTAEYRALVRRANSIEEAMTLLRETGHA